AIPVADGPQPLPPRRQPAGCGVAPGVDQADRLVAELGHRWMRTQTPGRVGDLLVALPARPRPEYVTDGPAHDQSCTKTHGAIMPETTPLHHRHILGRGGQATAPFGGDHDRIG